MDPEGSTGGPVLTAQGPVHVRKTVELSAELDLVKKQVEACIVFSRAGISSLPRALDELTRRIEVLEERTDPSKQSAPSGADENSLHCQKEPLSALPQILEEAYPEQMATADVDLGTLAKNLEEVDDKVRIYGAESKPQVSDAALQGDDEEIRALLQRLVPKDLLEVAKSVQELQAQADELKGIIEKSKTSLQGHVQGFFMACKAITADFKHKVNGDIGTALPKPQLGNEMTQLEGLPSTIQTIPQGMHGLPGEVMASVANSGLSRTASWDSSAACFTAPRINRFVSAESAKSMEADQVFDPASSKKVVSAAQLKFLLNKMKQNSVAKPPPPASPLIESRTVLVSPPPASPMVESRTVMGPPFGGSLTFQVPEQDVQRGSATPPAPGQSGSTRPVTPKSLTPVGSTRSLTPTRMASTGSMQPRSLTPTGMASMGSMQPMTRVLPGTSVKASSAAPIHHRVPGRGSQQFNSAGSLTTCAPPTVSVISVQNSSFLQ